MAAAGQPYDGRDKNRDYRMGLEKLAESKKQLDADPAVNRVMLILAKHERDLSDGFAFYNLDVIGTLRAIAVEILGKRG